MLDIEAALTAAGKPAVHLAFPGGELFPERSLVCRGKGEIV